MDLFQTANLRLEQQSAERAVLWIDVADRPVNVFSRQVLADFDAALSHVAGDPACRFLAIRSGKRAGFFAGADIHEFARIHSSQEASALSETGQRLFSRLAGLPQISIAVVSGACLGGGLECALACDYRLVVDNPKTQLGLPEIELGLLPAWGGTQRLPRVIGLERALRMILGRKRLNAREAMEWRLADALAENEDGIDRALSDLLDRARQEGKRSRAGLPLLGWRQKLVESNPIGRHLIFRGSRRVLRQRVPDDMPAPFEALEAVRTGIQHGIDAGLQYEREAAGRLALTPACRNLVTLFFLSENAKKPAVEPRPGLRLSRVAVVGAGTMGAGIAQLAALKRHEVIVQEVNQAALAAGEKRIRDLFDKAVQNQILSASEATDRLAAIRYTTSGEGLDKADLVVEAVIEDLDTKRAVFADLENKTRPTTILATNTSSLLVKDLQEGRQHPGRIAGLHFFNPVHKMPLVEVVRAPATDDATVAVLTQWAASLGKVPVVVRDSPGFLVNRILMPYLNEAVLLWTQDFFLGFEDRAIQMIDGVIRRFGMPVGPFELLDQVGLDVAAHIERTMRAAVGDRFPDHGIFDRMIAQGWTGQKSGAGFYRYRRKTKCFNRDILRLRNFQGSTLVNTDDWNRYQADLEETAGDRMVLLMVNEAAMCLGEGMVADAAALDLAMVFGTGWAPHRGGPLRYADDRGTKGIVESLVGLSKDFGSRFEPCDELRRRADTGEPFYPPEFTGERGQSWPR